MSMFGGGSDITPLVTMQRQQLDEEKKKAQQMKEQSDLESKMAKDKADEQRRARLLGGLEAFTTNSFAGYGASRTLGTAVPLG